MRILLTGSRGFVGRGLYRALASQHDVVTLARTQADVCADISRPLDGLEIGPLDAVIHTAAVMDGRGEDLDNINVDGTRHVAMLARRSGANQFLHFSTGGVYAPQAGPLAEDDAVAPTSAYGHSKLRSEKVLLDVADHICIKILRPFFPFGPGQAAERLVPRLKALVETGRPITLADEGGGPHLTPIFADDLVEYSVRALDVQGPFIANVGGTESVSMRDLALEIGRYGSREPLFQIAENGAPTNWLADSRRIRALCGFEPIIHWRAGVRRTFASPASPGKDGAAR